MYLRRWRGCLAAALALLLCAAAALGEGGGEIARANLADADSRDLVEALMAGAGISEARRACLFAHVDQVNAIMPEGTLAAGFEPLSTAEPRYDAYAVQDAWDAAYPDFIGYNCRITAFSLLGDMISVDAGALVRDEPLAFDLYALEQDGSALCGTEDLETFRRLFSSVETTDSTDPSVHAERILADWRARGVAFAPDARAHLVSVFLHDRLDGGAGELFIGHAGALLEAEDGGLWFIEKLAFQAPYRVLRLESRAALRDYLLAMYDASADGDASPPVILEDDGPLAGAR